MPYAPISEFLFILANYWLIFYQTNSKFSLVRNLTLPITSHNHFKIVNFGLVSGLNTGLGHP